MALRRYRALLTTFLLIEHVRHQPHMAFVPGKEVGMARGTVKWFNTGKGFGFIQPEDGSQDVFVHISALERAGMRDLRDGQKISYELVEDKRTGRMSADQLQAE